MNLAACVTFVLSPFCLVPPFPLLFGPNNQPGPTQSFVLLKQELSLQCDTKGLGLGCWLAAADCFSVNQLETVLSVKTLYKKSCIALVFGYISCLVYQQMMCRRTVGLRQTDILVGCVSPDVITRENIIEETKAVRSGPLRIRPWRSPCVYCGMQSYATARRRVSIPDVSHTVTGALCLQPKKTTVQMQKGAVCDVTDLQFVL